jgi:hypothetical protein
MSHPTPPITRLVTGLVAAMAVSSEVMAASGSFLLIRRDMRVQTVEVAQIGQRLVFREDGGGWASVAIDRCVALLRTDAVIIPRQQGWLTLTDGQRFPGQALSGARVAQDAFVWNQSSWLGRMEVPLDHVASVVFDPGATVPPAGDQDVLLLVNGDSVEGFVTALGDPVSLELPDDDNGPTSIELPLDRVHAVRMVSPPREPAGQRLWLVDGTIVDVERVVLGDDGYYRFEGVPFTEQGSVRIAPAGVVAVLFDPGALVPFASLQPRRVEGPPTRYVVPRPEVHEGTVALGLSEVEFRGPLAAHYVLPRGATYFGAEARLPESARAWGNCVLRIRDNDREVFTATLNAETPTALIGVRLTGSTLTVEVTEGSGGPIQDRVVLARAMVLVEE